MHRPDAPAPTPLDTFKVVLKSLANNRIGDDPLKMVQVWHPSGVETEGLPLLICLASYLNSGPSLTGWRNFGESIPERLDRLVADGALAPCVVAFVDSYNRLGGTQFVNSPVMGDWSDALADDLLPALEKRYGCGGPGKRALFGHSSGGFGALHNLVHRPDIWSAAASHAGDCGFDLVYRADLPKAVRCLADYNFDVERFLAAFWQQEKPKGEQISALMMLAMAGSYDPSDDPDDAMGLRLPIDKNTCEFFAERWRNWLDFDLLTTIPGRLDAVRSARAVYFDCGRFDEYNILYGSRRLSGILQDAEIAHRFEEFDGTHGTIGPRYEISLPFLVSSLT